MATRKPLVIFDGQIGQLPAGDTLEGVASGSGIDTALSFRQNYDNTTAKADPTSGNFRLNSTTMSLVTEGYFDNRDINNIAVTGIIDTFDDSTNTPKGYLRITEISDTSIYALYRTTTVVDETGYRTVGLEFVSNNGAFTNGTEKGIAFSLAGDKGADGATAGESQINFDTMLLMYDFTEGAGVSAKDKAKYNYDLSIRNGSVEATSVTWTASGPTIDTTNVTHMTTDEPTPEIDFTQPFSIFAKFNITDATNPFNGVLGKTTDNTWTDGCGLWCDAGGNLNFFIDNFSTGDLATGTFTEGADTSCAITWNGATLRLYINGVLADSVASNGVERNPEAPFEVGALGAGMSRMSSVATFDDVRVFAGIATDAEVLAYHNTTPPALSGLSDATFRGGWENDRQYILNDIVSFLGTTWKAKQQHTGCIPNAPSEVWQLIGPAPTEKLLYEHTFDGNAADDINGLEPDFSYTKDTFVANTTWKQDGSTTSASNSGCYLPFVPEDGKVYIYDCEIKERSTNTGETFIVPYTGFFQGVSSGSGGASNGISSPTTYRVASQLPIVPGSAGLTRFGTETSGAGGAGATSISWNVNHLNNINGDIQVRMILDTTRGYGDYRYTVLARLPSDESWTLMMSEAEAQVNADDIGAIGIAIGNNITTGYNSLRLAEYSFDDITDHEDIPTPPGQHVIYQHDFTPAWRRLGNRVPFDLSTPANLPELHGSYPQIGKEPFAAYEGWKQDGVFSDDGGLVGAFLPFTPEQGKVYYFVGRYRDLRDEVNTSNWFFHSFCEGVTDDKTATGVGHNCREQPTTNKWGVLNRVASVTANSSTYIGTGGTPGVGLAASQPLVASHEEAYPDVDIMLVLDTRGGTGNWVGRCYYKQLQVDQEWVSVTTNDAARDIADEVIGAIGIGLASSATNGRIASWSLSYDDYSNFDSAAGGSVVLSGVDNHLNTASTNSVIAGGNQNELTSAIQSTISGGVSNTSASAQSVIAGGTSNEIATGCTRSVIGGGSTNIIDTNSTEATIAGGILNNITNARRGFIGGGLDNDITGSAINECQYSSIVGGNTNQITDASRAVICGGESSDILAGGDYAGIVAGLNNLVETAATGSVIGGGTSNIIRNSIYSFVGAGFDSQIIDSEYSVVGSGVRNYITSSTRAGVFSGMDNTITNANRAVVCGGELNTIEDDGTGEATRSVICGGRSNETNGYETFIGGGDQCHIEGPGESAYAAIVCGINNTIETTLSTTDTFMSFIGSGASNTITDTIRASIVGGNTNTISSNSTNSFVGGGNSHTISASTGCAITAGATNSITVSAPQSFIGAGTGNDINNSQNAAVVAGSNGDITQSTAAFIGAGQNCTITSSAYGVVAGGNNCDINTGSVSSCILGGESNLITGADYSAIAGGRGSTVFTGADYSAITGGQNNQSNATHATCNGHDAVARHKGQVVQASGRISTNGDAQTWVATVRNATAGDTTPVDLFLDGASQVLSMPSDSVWGYRIMIVANGIGSIACACYEITGLIRRPGTGSAGLLLGTQSKQTFAETSGNFDAAVLASGNNLVVRVTGDTGQPLNWLARVEITELIGA